MFRHSAIVCSVLWGCSAGPLPGQADVTTASPKVPVEYGAIHWARDFDRAVEHATERDRPLLVLFQEVPG